MRYSIIAGIVVAVTVFLLIITKRKGESPKPVAASTDVEKKAIDPIQAIFGFIGLVIGIYAMFEGCKALYN